MCQECGNIIWTLLNSTCLRYLTSEIFINVIIYPPLHIVWFLGQYSIIYTIECPIFNYPLNIRSVKSDKQNKWAERIRVLDRSCYVTYMWTYLGTHMFCYNDCPHTFTVLLLTLPLVSSCTGRCFVSLFQNNGKTRLLLY